MIAAVFWAAVAAVGYTYAGYPALLAALARRRPPPAWPDAPPPRVTVLIAAYDEAPVIAAKLEETLALDYPREALQVLVATDGSTDGTDRIVAGFADRGVELSHQPGRAGKMAAIRRALPCARGEVVVLSDANNHFRRDTLRELVRPFADPRVGAVTGAKRIAGGDGVLGDSEGAYWRYEDRIRRDETRLGSCTGVNGEVFAIRRSLIGDPPEGIINDDFFLAMRAIAAGYRVAYAPAAVSTERVSPTARDEVVRRSRIVAGRYQAMAMAPRTLSRRQPLVAWQVVSHKFLRPLVPLCMLAALAANLAAVATRRGAGRSSVGRSWVGRAVHLEPPVGAACLAGQAAFYGAAVAGRHGSPGGRLGRPLYLATFLVDSNLAALHGLVRYLRGRQGAAWTKVRRREEPAAGDRGDAP